MIEINLIKNLNLKFLFGGAKDGHGKQPRTMFIISNRVNGNGSISVGMKKDATKDNLSLPDSIS